MTTCKLVYHMDDVYTCDQLNLKSNIRFPFITTFTPLYLLNVTSHKLFIIVFVHVQCPSYYLSFTLLPEKISTIHLTLHFTSPKFVSKYIYRKNSLIKNITITLCVYCVYSILQTCMVGLWFG